MGIYSGKELSLLSSKECKLPVTSLFYSLCLKHNAIPPQKNPNPPTGIYAIKKIKTIKNP